MKNNRTKTADSGLSKTEGVLSCISYTIGFGIAIYAAAKVSMLLLFALVATLVIPMGAHYKKVCKTCKNKCPFNPNNAFWK